MLRLLIVGIGLIMFGREICLGEGDFSIGNWNMLVSFLWLCNFRDPLLISRINGFGRMVIALNIQLTLHTFF